MHIMCVKTPILRIEKAIEFEISYGICFIKNQEAPAPLLLLKRIHYV